MSDDSVHIRNARALAEGLKNEIVKREAVQGRVDSLEQQITMFKTVIGDMQQQMQLIRAMTTGTGPTQR